MVLEIGLLLAEDPETSISTGGGTSGARWLLVEFLSGVRAGLEKMESAMFLVRMLDMPQDLEWDFKPISY